MKKTYISPKATLVECKATNMVMGSTLVVITGSQDVTVTDEEYNEEFATKTFDPYDIWEVDDNGTSLYYRLRKY